MCLGDSPTFWSSVISPNPELVIPYYAFVAELVIPYYAFVELLPRPLREVGLYFCISQLIEIRPGLVFPTCLVLQGRCSAMSLSVPHTSFTAWSLAHAHDVYIGLNQVDEKKYPSAKWWLWVGPWASQ